MDKDCMLEDLNRWIGDRVRGGIIGAFGATGEKRKWEKSSGYVLKEGCVWVTDTSNRRVCISTQGLQEAKMEWK